MNITLCVSHVFYCYTNQLQIFEFTVAEECCKSEYHPIGKSRVVLL